MSVRRAISAPGDENRWALDAIKTIQRALTMGIFTRRNDDMKTTITTDPSQRPGSFLKKNGASRPNEIEMGGHRNGTLHVVMHRLVPRRDRT